MDYFVSLLITGLVMGIIYALMALGLVGYPLMGPLTGRTWPRPSDRVILGCRNHAARPFRRRPLPARLWLLPPARSPVPRMANIRHYVTIAASARAVAAPRSSPRAPSNVPEEAARNVRRSMGMV